MSVVSINPHAPGDVVLRAPAGGATGAAEAVSRAGNAFPSWSRRPAAERAAALSGLADELAAGAEELATLVVREVGKPITEAAAEVARAVAILRFYGQMAMAADGESFPAVDDVLLFARRRPVGVCALLTPWNFPVAIPVWKLAPAVAFGNTVVLKPAPQASATAVLLAEMIRRHLPPGVVELVLGDAETGAPLLDHLEVAAVSFTGSTQVGRAVASAAARRGARVQAEMGGQNPAVVLADADLNRAAQTIATAAMGYAGQKCTATSRVIVEEPIYGEFRDCLVAAVESLEVLDPVRPGCQVGPVISADARAAVAEALGRSRGRVLTGGDAIEAEGFYVRPTLVELDGPADVFAREEVFAPIAGLLRAETAQQAIDLANDVPLGLVAALFTSDLSHALREANRLEAGLVRVNAPTTGVDFHAPFGGTKQSSYGPREQGLAARDFYTETVTVTLAP